ncbi:protein translocase subunit SecA [Striga asiatica]|uniref:Protein translocase subunit SecA n=1 Tax=Striga asiatica TaxID=4170 RepID=A0A5A7P6H8_STRAF|nr:protein translocase subunit SecA [Striga asiatica]
MEFTQTLTIRRVSEGIRACQNYLTPQVHRRHCCPAGSSTYFAVKLLHCRSPRRRDSLTAADENYTAFQNSGRRELAVKDLAATSVNTPTIIFNDRPPDTARRRRPPSLSIGGPKSACLLVYNSGEIQTDLNSSRSPYTLTTANVSDCLATGEYGDGSDLTGGSGDRNFRQLLGCCI